MQVTEEYTGIRTRSRFGDLSVRNDTISTREFDFTSHAYKLLPGIDEHYCGTHDRSFQTDFSYYTEVGTINRDVYIRDIFVEENQRFTYQILMPSGVSRASKVTFLFHGFNEKDWKKYIPWAEAICEGTGSAVVLFPLAFHMQRAPKLWSSPRDMYRLSQERRQRFPDVMQSSLSNVAISMRLHSMPQRFIWSGLQSYYDVIQLIEEFKSGKNDAIHPDFSFDIFAYSIGGFLAQILKMTNYREYFSKAKVMLFCSGSTFNRFSPVSKFILDSEANVSLYSYMVEHFDRMLEKDPMLNHFINEGHPEGKVFHAMLDFQKMRDFREDLLRRYEDQFYAITLKEDSIIPSFEIMNTLQGAYRDIQIPVDEMDFNRPYTHENPFASFEADPELAEQDFERVFEKVVGFFRG